MKVLLSLLGTVAITSSSVSFASSNVFVGQKQAIEKQKIEAQKGEEIDYAMLAESTNNYFNNFKQQQLFSNNPAQTAEMEQAINYAKEVSLNYVQKFTEQNLNLEEIINQISNEVPEFKTYYENSINEVTKKQINISNFDSNTLFAKDKSLSSISTYSTSAGDIMYYLGKVVNDVRAWKLTASTISAGAAIAAVGFWAAAWWFGFTIPWAAACTTISTVSGLIAMVLGKAINVFENKPVNPTWQDAYNVADSMISDILGDGLAGKRSILSVVKWAFLGVNAIISVFGAVEDWQDYLDHL